MADPARRRGENAAGPWFVDDTCIDCGTCMWLAPHAFREAGGQSAVFAQPEAADRDAAAALVACPTASIGGPAGAGKLGVAQFPRPIAPNVWHLGYHDPSSFGATAYLVRTEAGNVMVDVPRFAGPLVKAVEGMGGLQAIVLTHRDDVAAHQEWHDRFGAPRVIHRDDDLIGAEVALEGERGTVAGLDWLHVPGHTRGSVVYRLGDVAFTGDHLAGRGDGGLTAFRNACWFDWGKQWESMAKMADWEIRHVLPGHDEPWSGASGDYRAAMADLLAWMARA
jgi:glyoxylase-like metal-dependent hydrolase (beta-lactamase superfamily II)/ferredoxin